MKYTKITPINKKNHKSGKEYYHLTSIFPNLSKVFERLVTNQIYPCFHVAFSKFQCGLRKGFNAHYCLLAIEEELCKILDGVKPGAVLTHLFKAFIALMKIY